MTIQKKLQGKFQVRNVIKEGPWLRESERKNGINRNFLPQCYTQNGNLYKGCVSQRNFTEKKVHEKAHIMCDPY